MNEAKAEVTQGDEAGLTNWKRSLLEGVEGKLKKAEPGEFRKGVCECSQVAQVIGRNEPAQGNMR